MSEPAKESSPFYVVQDVRVPLECLAEERLGRLLDYWHRSCSNGHLPTGPCIDPAALGEHLTRLHILDVEGPLQFRYRLYGTRVTNPDLADMTGKLTTEYRDTAFGNLVTAHLAECVEAAAPVCREIIAVKIGLPYSYRRLILPWSNNDGRVTKLMVSPHRLLVPDELDRSQRSQEYSR